MANLVATTEDMTTVANAIRTKGGASAPLSFPDEFASAIQAIPGPKPEQEKEITITENGDFPITPDVGKVLSKVLAHVNVSGEGGGGAAVETLTFTLAKEEYKPSVTLTPPKDNEYPLWVIVFLAKNQEDAPNVTCGIFEYQRVVAGSAYYRAYRWGKKLSVVYMPEVSGSFPCLKNSEGSLTWNFSTQGVGLAFVAGGEYKVVVIW